MFYLIPPLQTDSTASVRSPFASPEGSLDFGVVDEFGFAVNAALHLRGGKKLVDAKRLEDNWVSIDEWEEVPGRWFYGGIFFLHFGHFLTESVHRISLFKAISENFDGIVFIKAPFRGSISYDPLSFPYVTEVLSKYFQLDLQMVRFLDVPTALHDLKCLPQAQQLNSPSDSSYLKILASFQEEYIKLTSVPRLT